MNGDQTSSPKPKTAWLFWAAFFLFLGLSFLNLGLIGLHGANYALHGLILDLIQDPTKYPNDLLSPYVEAYPTHFWRAVSLLESVIGRVHAFRFSVLAQRALMFLSMAALCRALAGKLAWPATVLTWVALAWPIGFPKMGEAHFGLADFCDQTKLCVPFLIFSTATFIERRYRISALWLGVATLLNAAFSFYLLPFLTLGVLASGRLKKDRKKLLEFVGILVLFSVPILSWALSGSGPRGTVPDELWLRIALQRSSHHLVISAWPVGDLTRFYSMVGFTFATGMWLRPRDRRSSNWILAFSVGALLWLFVSWFFSSIFPVRAILTMAPGRAFSGFFALFLATSALALALFIYRGLRKPPSSRLAWALTLSLISIAAIHGSRALRKPRIQNAPLVEWAKNNTPPKSLFLVPPDWEFWRVDTGRPTFLLWKDGLLHFYSEPFAREWIRRLHFLGVHVESIPRNGAAFSAALDEGFSKVDLRSVGAIRDAGYPIAYWIRRARADAAQDFNARVVFSHGSYEVLEIVTREPQIPLPKHR